MPTSAIDTRYAKRGGVMQGDTKALAWLTLEGRPLDVPVEPPQQPAPGAAGQTTSNAARAACSSTMPAPTQAIGTQPKEFADPLAGFWDDADVAAEKQAEQEAHCRVVASDPVRPGGEVFSGQSAARSCPSTARKILTDCRRSSRCCRRSPKEDTTKTWPVYQGKLRRPSTP